MIERFFMCTNTAWILRRRYANHGEARRGITEDIVGFYNVAQSKTTRAYLPPRVYEPQTAAEPLNTVSEII